MQAGDDGIVLVNALEAVGEARGQAVGELRLEALIVESAPVKLVHAAARRGGSESISRSSTKPLRRTFGKTMDSRCMSSEAASGRSDMMSRL